jgi:NitT/TauT family transport system substrate-binding protein
MNNWLSRLALMVGAVCVFALPAQAKDTITFAYLLDPAYEAVVWPIAAGKITSDTIDVEMKALDIPALLQATGAKQYDVIMTAAIGVPQAKAHGLDLEIMATALRNHPEGGKGGDIFVRADSPYHTLADLKGKTIGNYSLPSTGTTLLRIALAKKFGFNVAFDGGDFKWVQMPASALPGALATHRIDAASLSHSQAYLAEKDKTFRVLIRLNKSVNEAVGGPAISAILASYPEKLKERPAAFKEFARMIAASNVYARSHVAEVAAAMSAKTKLEPAYFGTWLKEYFDTPMTISDTDLLVIENLWIEAKALGIIKTYPDIKTVVWPGALRQ